MRFKLLLITLITLPLVVVAQQQHNDDVVFYNAGQMYVGVSNDLSKQEGTSTNEAAFTTKDIRLYIDGSLKVVDNSQIQQRGGTALTGDFIAAGAGTPFVENTTTGLTSKGANLYQNNAIYFINDVMTDGTSPNTQKIYKPNGITSSYATGMASTQYIRLATTATVDKKSNVLYFPNIVVGSQANTTKGFSEAKSYLIVEDNIAMTVPYVVVEPGAMFSVQTKPLSTTSNAAWTPGGVGSSLRTAHIQWSNNGVAYDDDAKASITSLGSAFAEGGYGVVRRYKTNSKTDPADWEWSYAQHDLQVYDPAIPATNKRSGKGADGVVRELNYLYPFAPLMNELRSDYMTFNTQYILGEGSVTDFGDTNLDPRKLMGPATYFAIDVTNYDYDVIQDNPNNQDVKSTDRSVGGYVFSRKFLNARPGFNFFTKAGTGTVSGGANPYIAEVINSKGANQFYDFPMDNSDLYGRFRVIGNNSFLPLDLSIICQPDGTEVATSDIQVYKLGSDGKKTSTQNVVIGKPSATMYLRNKFWIPFNSVIYATRNPGNQPIGGPQTPTVNYYYVDYFEAQKIGGTATLTGEDFLLAPMQLALVQIGNKAGAYNGISLSTNLFKHDNAITAKSATSIDTRRDEVLLQIINEGTGKEDRTVVVLREDAKLDGTNTYDSEKQTPVSNEKIGVGATELTKSTDFEVQSMTEGAIYTQATTGARMSTNIIPSSIKQLPLYVVPPVSTTEEFTITPYRLETLQTVDEVWLEDKHTNTFTLLTPETHYKFQADPLTGDEAAKNRFVLHFGKVAKDEVIIGDNESDISCYYTNTTLYIRGLNSKDIGSDVRIFDMQGRLVGNTKITNVPVDTYLKSLSSGAYIVKISGARNYTTKLLNLQH